MSRQDTNTAPFFGNQKKLLHDLKKDLSALTQTDRL